MLELAAGAALVPAAMATSMAAPAPLPVLPSRNALFVRLRGAPRGQPALWWFTGMLWGKRSLDAAQALFAVEGCSFNRLVLNADDSVEMNMVEAGFWLDPSTRLPADTWTNPMNGLACTPVHFAGPQSLRFDAAGSGQPTNSVPAGTTFSGRITDPMVSGDLVWVGETLIVKGPARPRQGADPLESGLPVFTATSLDTYHGRRQDLGVTPERWVPASRSYQTLGSWYPWMRMGHESGGISFQMVGRKLRTVDELPAGLQALLESRQPGWLAQHAG
jgi:Protein of unknown function (DUF1838)